MKRSLRVLSMLLLICMIFWTAAAQGLGPYTDNGNGTVADRGTGLTWQQATADINNDGVISFSDELIWQDALDYCENLGLAGHNDWRLPKIGELTSIVDRNRYTPAIDPIFMSQSLHYWSATTDTHRNYYAWFVFFANGHDYRYHKTHDNYVRCVRGGLYDN